jgi:hypothetical protein
VVDCVAKTVCGMTFFAGWIFCSFCIFIF